MGFNMQSNYLQLLASFVAVIGGLFGVYVFLDSYVLPFNPLLRIANTIYFVLNPSKTLGDNKLKLVKIVCKIEIFNKQNSIGKIDNFMVSVFNPSEVRPVADHLFPLNELTELPVTEDSLNETKKYPFTPKTILAKSSKECVCEFVPSDNSAVFCDPNSPIKIGLRFAFDRKRWVEFGEFTLKSRVNPIEVDQYRVYRLSTYDLLPDPDTLHDLAFKVKSNAYTGLEDYCLNRWMRLPYYYAIAPFQAASRYLKLIIDLTKSASKLVYSELVTTSITKIFGSKIIKLRFSSGNAQKSEQTDAFIKYATEYISKRIEAINIASEADSKIQLSCDNGAILLTRLNKTIVIYKSGDSAVIVQHKNTPSHFGSIVFVLTLKEYPLGIFLWNFEGVYPAFRKTICAKILDYFTFHTCYPG